MVHEIYIHTALGNNLRLEKMLSGHLWSTILSFQNEKEENNLRPKTDQYRTLSSDKFFSPLHGLVGFIIIFGVPIERAEVLNEFKNICYKKNLAFSGSPDISTCLKPTSLAISSNYIFCAYLIASQLSRVRFPQ